MTTDVVMEAAHVDLTTVSNDDIMSEFKRRNLINAIDGDVLMNVVEQRIKTSLPTVPDTSTPQVQRALLQVLAEIATKADLVETVATCPHLKSCAQLKIVHERLYTLAEFVSEHKHNYECAVATTASVLVNSFVKTKLEMEAARRPAAKAKGVIKKDMKATVRKQIEVPSNLYMNSIKQFLTNAKNMLFRQQLTAAGVDNRIIDKSVDEYIEPVQGVAEANPNIWGALV